MLRGRLVELAGRPVEQVQAASDAEWVLRGDRGLSFADELPPSSTLVAGEWWPKDYDGPPLVSFEAGAARGLGLRLGDVVKVNVLGRDIEARIASLRQVRWESLSLNFVMLFSPNALNAAPYKLLATLTLPPGEGGDVEGRLVSRIAAAFPAVTPIGVREALAAVDGVLRRIIGAIELASLVVLLAGALALAGAFAATHQQRLGDAIIFKVLGATRPRILGAHALEYVALAVVSGTVASVFGTLTAWVVVTRLMKLDFAFSWLAIGEVFLVVLLLVLPLGLIRTWRVLGHKSSTELRRL
jgi:putative ABC transport system permease protein